MRHTLGESARARLKVQRIRHGHCAAQGRADALGAQILHEENTNSVRGDCAHGAYRCISNKLNLYNVFN